jgi:hypothetical protein
LEYQVIGHEGYHGSSPDGKIKSNEDILTLVALGRKWFVTDSVASAASCASSYISCLEKDRQELLDKIRRLENSFLEKQTKCDSLTQSVIKKDEAYNALAQELTATKLSNVIATDIIKEIGQSTQRILEKYNVQPNQGQELPETTVSESKCEARPRSRKRTPKVSEKA